MNDCVCVEIQSESEWLHAYVCVCSGSCLCGCCCQRSIRRRFLDAIRTESTFTITKGTRRESGKGIGIGESTTIVVVIQIVVVVGSFLLLLLPTWPLLCAQLQVITVSSHLPPTPAHAAAVSTHNIHKQSKNWQHTLLLLLLFGALNIRCTCSIPSMLPPPCTTLVLLQDNWDKSTTTTKQFMLTQGDRQREWGRERVSVRVRGGERKGREFF